MIKIYTDGSCLKNPGNGGWAAIICTDNEVKKISGSEKDTTNNRMELKAAIEALSSLKSKSDVVIFTDSKYLMQGINSWIENWKTNNWLTSNKKEVKNIDLWKDIDKYNNFHTVEWNWVKGHSGDIGNDTADELANLAISNKTGKNCE